jgi:hypothetical protein
VNKDVLEGIVISEGSNIPISQQFDTFFEALKVYGGGKNVEVKTALETLKDVDEASLMPKFPDKSEWCTYITETDDDGSITLKEHVDKEMKSVALECHIDDKKAAKKQYRKYTAELKALLIIIMGQLDRGISDSLKSDAKFESINRENNTIALVKMLRELCYRENNAKVSPANDLLTKAIRYLTSKQDNKETATYVDEVKMRYEVFRSAGGTMLSPELIKYTLKRNDNMNYSYEQYERLDPDDTSDQIIMTKINIAAEQLMMATIIIRGSNSKMYNNLNQELNNDYAKGMDNHPLTANDAQETMNQYRVKSNGQVGKDRRNSRNNRNGNTPQKDHESKAQEGTSLANVNIDKKSTSTDESKSEAYQLLLKGDEDDAIYGGSQFQFVHAATFNWDDSDSESEGIPDLIPRIEYDSSDDEYESHDNEDELDLMYHNDQIYDFDMDNKEKMRSEHIDNIGCYCNIQQFEEGEIVNHDTTRNKTSTHNQIDMTKMFVLAQANAGIVNPNWILLDSQASCNVMCNPELVSNIRTAPNGETMTIHCNAGSVVINTIATLAGIGLVWFHPKGIANCLSLALVSDKYRVTLDTDASQAFILHKADGVTRRFERMTNNLYACDVTERILVTTVKGQKESYSQLDARRAKAARKMQEILGYPSDKEYMKMVDHNLIKNCKITRRDIIIANDIYGVNPNIIKGKTVRQQPDQVREDIIPVIPSILRNYGKVTLAIDVYHINGIKFFRSISRHLMFRCTRPIRNARQSTLFECIKAIQGLYATRGFEVVQILGDNEFECLKDKMMSDLHITFSAVASGAHEAHIERDNRTSKERVRCMYSSSPFKRMPPRMVIEMQLASDFWLNYWCSSGGVSKTIPPREIMTGIKLDASKHCRFQFGDYVLAHEGETDNTMRARATDAIYLRPTGNANGGFYVFDLDTARRVHRRSATAGHMTNTIIDRVESIARQQDAPVGITFANMHNTSTVLDIDVDEENDDDDASDDSYTPGDDDTIDSDMTNITMEEDPVTSDNLNDDERIDPSQELDSEIEPTQQQRLEVRFINNGTPDPPISDDEEDDDNDEHIIDQSENGDDLHDDHLEIADITAETGSEDDLVVNEDHNRSTDNQDMEDNNENTNPDSVDPSENSGVRKSNRLLGVEPEAPVNIHHELKGHNNPPISESHSLFTNGFSNAVGKLEREHTGYMLIAAAVDQYNSLEASMTTPQYGVAKGLKLFGEDGVNAVLKELRQLHDMEVVSGVHPSDLSREEVKRALPYLMFLKRKRSGKVKGRGCADGRSQREFISKDEASSPTVNTYGVFLTCIIEAIEQRDTATVDIPGAFLQTMMPEDEPPTHVKIFGAMAELFVREYPELRKFLITTKRGTKILYCKANKAIYGTLRAALLFWENLSGKLREWGFEHNNYDSCTVNKIINGKQATIVWHVDDLKISHIDPDVVTSIIKLLEDEFGKTAPLTIRRGLSHEYLGMDIEYTDKQTVIFTMFDYLEDIIATLPEELRSNRKTTTPAADHLFAVNENAVKLKMKQADMFHSYVAKLLFAGKRARPDLQTAIAFLCTRVQSPDEDDWKKLIRLLGYVKDTLFLPLVLGSDGTGNIYWYVDASFAVHNDMRSHTGAMITLGKGAAMSMSTKQKINTKSSTEAELVGVDDGIPFNIWCYYYLRDQGFHAHQCNPHDDNAKKFGFQGHTNILYQDNTSTIRLEENGKASSTKRTRHINIRYFLITDKIKRGEVTVEYCPTEEMLADYFTKPLQGSLFKKLRNAILGITDADYLTYKASYDINKIRNE